MLIYSAVKKYRNSKAQKEREQRERAQQSGQTAFNTSSRPSHNVRMTQGANQVS